MYGVKLISEVCVSDALVAEIKKIVKDSEIMKSVVKSQLSLSLEKLTPMQGG